MRTIPNWCHCTLTITGDPDELARFVQAARPSERLVRRWWKQAKADTFFKEKRTFKQYLADIRENQPLSFGAIVPEPTPEQYAAIEEEHRITCTMCGGGGTLPDSEAEAILQGAKWFEWMDPAEREDRTCNVCHGSGRELPFGKEGWWLWRHANWGCKWDASFGEPFLALGASEMDVDETVAALGQTVTPTMAVYKFDTPWGPPGPFVKNASEAFPELEFALRFGEPGGGFAGELRYLSGLLIAEEELEVEDVLMPEEMWF